MNDDDERVVDEKDPSIYNYYCKICNERFDSFYDKTVHLFHIHGEELKCEFCKKKKFETVKKLNVHFRWVHSEKSYKCFKCEFSTSIRGKLNRHVKIMHDKEYAYNCKICSKGFIDKFDLEEHKNLHSGNMPHQCEICGKSFRLKTTLRAHRYKFHVEDLSHVCKLCKKGFATKSGLDSHFSLHAEKKKFICHFCGKNLSTFTTLTEHIRIHTGEKPYVCDVCQKGFAAKKHLFRHVKQHYENNINKKNHECLYCWKKFSNYVTCLSHIKKCSQRKM